MEEIFIDGPNELKLRTCYWYRANTRRGSILGVHGYSEHSGRYAHVANFFNDSGYQVCFVDLPGHGKSGGPRSDISDFNDYVKSLESLVHYAQRESLPAPYYLFGHSLGGLVCIRFLETSELSSSISRTFLSSPFLRVSSSAFNGIARILQGQAGRGIIKGLSSLLPSIRLQNKSDLGGSVLTHDKEMIKDRESDTLINTEVTTHFTREFLRAQSKAFEDAGRIDGPLAIFAAGDDRVVDKNASEEFLQLLNPRVEKRWIEYPGLWHEIVNEVQRDQVMKDMLQWITSEDSSQGVA